MQDDHFSYKNCYQHGSYNIMGPIIVIFDYASLWDVAMVTIA